MRLSKKYYKLLIYVFLILVIFTAFAALIRARERYQDRLTYIEQLVQPTSSFPLHKNWDRKLGQGPQDYPAYQDGLIIMPASNFFNYWYGLEAKTGEVVWRQQVPEQNFLRCLTPEYLVLSGPKSFLALRRQTGVIIWQRERANTASCSETTVFYSEVPRNSISAVKLSTGHDLWRGTQPRKMVSGLIYNPETDEIVADGNIVVEANSGVLKRYFNVATIAPQGGPPWRRGPMYLIDQGQLFVGEDVLDTQTGQIIHKEQQYGTARPPTVTADTMYLAALSDGVVAFDRTNYEVKWIYPSPLNAAGTQRLETISSVAILNEIGYVIFADATLRAFDLETGQELGYWQPSPDDLWDWRVCTYPNPRSDCIESARAGLATSDDTLFVSFGDGKLYAFGK